MREPSRLVSLSCLAVAIVLFFATAIPSMRQKTATYDEPVYIVAGLSYLTLGDYTLKDDAPPLVAYLAGLSPIAHGLEIPGGKLGFGDSLGKEYPFAKKLLYGSGADADSIVFWSRFAVLVPFGLLLLVTVWLWAGSMFGGWAACVATLSTALSPNLIAHARLVAADFPSTAAIVFASFLLYRFTQQPTRGRALALGGALGLALATKFTALLLVPAIALVLALTVVKDRTLRSRHLLACVGLIVVPALVATTLIYGSFDVTQYWRGVSNIYRNVQSNLVWYFFGGFYPGGLKSYYLGALSVKTSAPLLILGLASVLFIRRKSAGLTAELCLFLPAILMLLAAINDTTPAGLRRVLLVLPVLAITGSRIAAWIPLLAAKAAIPIGLLLLWHTGSSLLAWPHYIPYFNELAGGRDAGPEYLADSNIDWGQDLAALPAVLEKHGVQEPRLLYFGQAEPAYYGVRAEPLTMQTYQNPPPGDYAISLHFLIRGRARPGNWLDRFEPIAKAGTSIWLFRIR